MAIPAPDRTPTDEVMDFLLSAPTPEQVIALRPSLEAQERLRYLLDGNRNEALNDSERAEKHGSKTVEDNLCLTCLDCS